jgi:hypothetical protein
MITPRHVFDSYPGSDLVGIDPPIAEETFADYIRRVGRGPIQRCGDTLYAFLLFEMADSGGNAEEALRMLDTAIRDVESVRNYINSRS